MSEAILAAVNDALALNGATSFNDSDAAAGGSANPVVNVKAAVAPSAAPKEDNQEEEGKREMQPSPFFHYRNFSEVEDPDPLTPLTFPGRVPNFPAKMHAILSRPDLSDIVAWMPHGRSWRILKPREFEVRVIVSRHLSCWMQRIL